MSSAVSIGTSGYTYSWNKGKQNKLKWYVDKGFNSVEINGSFYRFPTASWVANWKSNSPAGFVFSIKIHRAITHYSRFGEKALKLWNRFIKPLQPMEKKINYWLFHTPSIDFSNTGDVIIGKGNNKTLADEKGKKISVEGINSFSHLFVLKALNKVGLDEGDGEIANVPAQNVTQELDKGTIAAGHIYQPYTSEALKKGYKILFSAGEIPGAITDVIVFRTNVIRERPHDVQAIIKSIIEAQKYYDDNKEESLRIMSNKSGIEIQAIKNGLDSVCYPR
ncbi:MAG: DUF72 domain-containing protein [Candidatus Eiseniibacteriota bacterium]